MRRLCLISMSIAALGVGAPAHAQQLSAVPALNVIGGASPDAVVARLMTFDRNDDGIVTRAELPERMQGLLTRVGGAGGSDAIDATQIRRIALQPSASASANGLQIGHYGLGDGLNFDTRLHIDGALDDLRLASDVREKAGKLAHDVQSTGDERARTHLLATMETLLPAEQFADFKASLDGHFVTVRAIRQNGVLVFGATPDEVALQQPIEVTLRLTGSNDLSNLVANYNLTGESLLRAKDEIEQFMTHRSGRLSPVDRQAIVDALQGLLDGQQQGDLRAALERRPLVKQGQGVSAVFVNVQGTRGVVQGSSFVVNGHDVVIAR